MHKCSFLNAHGKTFSHLRHAAREFGDGVGGVCVAEARFLPYGEPRYTNGNSPTDFGFAEQKDMPGNRAHLHARLLPRLGVHALHPARHRCVPSRATSRR
jgi:hypothetical protein